MMSAGFSLRDFASPEARAQQVANITARAAGDQAVRALPDDLFADHPRVVAAREAFEVAQKRAEKLATMPRKAVTIDDLLSRLEAELADLDSRLRFAALDDFLAGAVDFQTALEVMERRDHVEKCIRAARLVKVEVVRGHHALTEHRELASTAESEYSTTVLQLKRQYLIDHPELATDSVE